MQEKRKEKTAAAGYKRRSFSLTHKRVALKNFNNASKTNKKDSKNV